MNYYTSTVCSLVIIPVKYYSKTICCCLIVDCCGISSNCEPLQYNLFLLVYYCTIFPYLHLVNTLCHYSICCHFLVYMYYCSLGIYEYILYIVTLLVPVDIEKMHTGFAIRKSIVFEYRRLVCQCSLRFRNPGLGLKLDSFKVSWVRQSLQLYVLVLLETCRPCR